MTDPDDSQPAFNSAIEHNRRAWNRRAVNGERFTRPLLDAELSDSRIDPWLGNNIANQRILVLAGGGGRQSAVLAAAGASVTVVDVSGEMLALDRDVARDRQLDIRTVETSMDDLSMFPVASFDAVVQPVSTCYVPDIIAVYRHVARVIKAGGLYISQHKQPVSMQCDVESSPRGGYELVEPYFRTGPLPDVVGSLHREPGTLEFLHRWEELIGGLCRNGFVVEDLVEPRHAKPDAEAGTFADRSRYVAPYVRIKARRVGEKTVAASLVWTP
jgi:SAM-dependent methyltransferase